jgi:hypothetical protein
MSVRQTIETLGSWPLAGGFTSVSCRRSSRPRRVAFLNANPALPAGLLLSLGSSGTTPPGVFLSPYFDPYGQPQARLPLREDDAPVQDFKISFK